MTKKEDTALMRIAEGIDDQSFKRFYAFFLGYGILILILTCAPYILFLAIPRHLFDFNGPKEIMTYLPKFWLEAKNFKEIYPSEAVNFYFFTMLFVYAVILSLSVVAATRCYRTGLQFPFSPGQHQPWSAHRAVVIPALVPIMFGMIVPLPVGWESTGSRGNPFANPILLPLYSIAAIGLLPVLSAVGGLWLGQAKPAAKTNDFRFAHRTEKA
ncbi:hypothetical protein [Ensifer sp. 4252]|uniref:hypothetical protein n=1 Tax=Ensifer sp. 4252 TaxID=3373915 RepID=UPI003D1FBF48